MIIHGPHESLIWGYRVNLLASMAWVSTYDSDLYKMFQLHMITHPNILFLRLERLEPMVQDGELILDSSVRLECHIKVRRLISLDRSNPIAKAVATIAPGLTAEIYESEADTGNMSAFMSVLADSYGFLVEIIFKSEVRTIDQLGDILANTFRIEPE